MCTYLTFPTNFQSQPVDYDFTQMIPKSFSERLWLKTHILRADLLSLNILKSVQETFTEHQP